jgi:hypothetical protein
MIIRCELTNNNEGTYRLAEILKDDGSVVLKHAQGDVVHLLVKKRGDEVLASETIILIGRPDPRIQMIEYRTYTELYVIDGRMPGLGGMSVAELRTVISRTKD